MNTVHMHLLVQGPPVLTPSQLPQHLGAHEAREVGVGLAPLRQHPRQGGQQRVQEAHEG